MTFLACPTLLACAACGGAKAPWGSAPPPRPASISDSLLVLVPIRTEEQIRADLELVNQRMRLAATEKETAQLLQTRAKTAIDLKEAEKKSMQANLELAKNEKNTVAESEWKSKIALAEMEKELLQERASLRDTEIAVAEARRKHWEAMAKAFDTELELAGKRKQRAEFAKRESSVEVLSELQRIDRDIEVLEKRTLETQLEGAKSFSTVSNNEAELAKRRLKVLEAQAKFLRGG
jgi:hypothetical protein